LHKTEPALTGVEIVSLEGIRDTQFMTYFQLDGNSFTAVIRRLAILLKNPSF
jgi:hypothetical protein